MILTELEVVDLGEGLLTLFSPFSIAEGLKPRLTATDLKLISMGNKI